MLHYPFLLGGAAFPLSFCSVVLLFPSLLVDGAFFKEKSSNKLNYIELDHIRYNEMMKITLTWIKFNPLK